MVKQNPEDANYDSPRARRALQHAARRDQSQAPASHESPSPPSLPPKQPLHHSTQPTEPLPAVLTQPNWGVVQTPGPSTLTSNGVLADEDFFSSPDIAVNQERENPEGDESFFTEGLASDAKFDELEEFDMSEQDDIFSHVPELVMPSLPIATVPQQPPPSATAPSTSSTWACHKPSTTSD
ncbi:hypothetical protein H1R20_g1266, partial [Candolleomyces eurysporus]